MSAPRADDHPRPPVAEAASADARRGTSIACRSSTRRARSSASSAAATSSGRSPRATTRSAREIEEDVIRQALWLDPDAVDVTVTDGVVTLEGEVESAAEAELLPSFIRGCPASSTVELIADRTGSRRDGRLAGRLPFSYFVDGRAT